MAKENTLSKHFVVANILIEFVQMALFSFRPSFHWGGLSVDTTFSLAVIGYPLYRIFFWLVIFMLTLAALNVAYVGYSFHSGEVRSIILIRTLRWICCLLVTILFIPILYILLPSLACDYTTSPAQLMTFPSTPCWEKDNFVTGIVGALFLIIFTLFSFFTGLTYYEYDPTDTRVSGRLQNRLDFGTLWVKFILVFMDMFLKNSTIAFAVVAFFLFFSLFVVNLVLLPAYERRMNLMRSGAYAGILWVYVSGLIAIGISDSANYSSIVALVLGTPASIGFGVFVADRRLKSVCNPKLVDQVVTATEDDPQPSKPSLTKVVKWEQPKNNKYMKTALESRLIVSTDVEMASRFVLVGNPSTAQIEKAKVVYQIGMAKFPHSPSVLQAYSNFLFFIVGDFQMGYVVLEKLRKLNPPLDVKFFIYRHDKDREQRTEGGRDGNFVDFMEFKKQQQAAKRYHTTALICIRKFWQCLLAKKVDIMDLSSLSSKIAEAEKRTAEQYTKLLESHPKNVRLLRDYARFLEEIASNERGAYEMWRRADRYEEKEMEKVTDSHRSQEKSEGTDSESVKSGDDTGSSSAKSDTETDIDDKTDISRGSGVDLKISVVREEKNKKLGKLSWILFFTSLFVIAVSFTQLGILNTQLDNYKLVVQTLDGSGGVVQTGIRTAISAFDLGVIAGTAGYTKNPNTSLPWTSDYGSLIQLILPRITLFFNDLRCIYWGNSDREPFTSVRRLLIKNILNYQLDIDPTAAVLPFTYFDQKSGNKAQIENFFDSTGWTQSNWLVNYAQIGSGLWTAVSANTSFWRLTYEYARAGLTLTTTKIQSFINQSNTDSAIRSLYFLSLNARTVATATRSLMQLSTRYVQEELNVLKNVVTGLFVATIGMLVLAVFFLLRPVVTDIFSYKIRTLYTFTLIPESVVRHMSRKKISSLRNENQNDNEQNIAKEDEEIEENEERDEEKEGSDGDGPAAILHTPRHFDADKKVLLPNECSDDESPHRDGYEPSGVARSHTTGGATLVRSQPTILLESVSLPEGFGSKPDPGLIEMLPLTGISSDRVATTSASKIVLDIKSQSDTQVSKRIHMPDAQDAHPARVHPLATSFVQQHTKPVRRARAGSKLEELKKDTPKPSGGGSDRRMNKFKKKLAPLQYSVAKKSKVDYTDMKPSTPGTLETDLASRRKMRSFETDHSRINVRSLRSVLMKLHLAYAVGILLIMFALGISYAVSENFLNNLGTLAEVIEKMEERTQFAHLVTFDLTNMVSSTYSNPIIAEAGRYFPADLENFWNLHLQLLNAPGVDQSIMFGDGCLRINKSLCPDKTYPYYEAVSHGLHKMVYNFYTTALELEAAYRRTNSSLMYSPDLLQLRVLMDVDLYDALEIVVFNAYVYAYNQIAIAKWQISVVVAVEVVCFFLIHVFFFRPFIRRLQQESEHTFSLIRMIPRKLVQNIPEISEFIRETMEAR